MVQRILCKISILILLEVIGIVLESSWAGMIRPHDTIAALTQIPDDANVPIFLIMRPGLKTYGYVWDELNENKLNHFHQKYHTFVVGLLGFFPIWWHSICNGSTSNVWRIQFIKFIWRPGFESLESHGLAKRGWIWSMKHGGIKMATFSELYHCSFILQEEL